MLAVDPDARERIGVMGVARSSPRHGRGDGSGGARSICW